MPLALANSVCSIGQHGQVGELDDTASKQAIEVQNLKASDGLTSRGMIGPVCNQE